MKHTPLKIIGLAAVLVAAVCAVSFSQDESPVRITFDRHSKRIDIVTGKQLPDYTLAERGSILFYFGRLDKPEEGFGYFFDGRGYQNIKGLAVIRKMPKLGTWAILGSRGWRGSEQTTVRTNPLTICEIEQHAVSFIPLNTGTKKPGPRVYVLLDDLYKIQWREVDHWVATMGQDEFDAAQGTMY